jgi:hypothetical protein
MLDALTTALLIVFSVTICRGIAELACLRLLSAFLGHEKVGYRTGEVCNLLGEQVSMAFLLAPTCIHQSTQSDPQCKMSMQTVSFIEGLRYLSSTLGSELGLQRPLVP